MSEMEYSKVEEFIVRSVSDSGFSVRRSETLMWVSFLVARTDRTPSVLSIPRGRPDTEEEAFEFVEGVLRGG